MHDSTSPMLQVVTASPSAAAFMLAIILLHDAGSCKAARCLHSLAGLAACTGLLCLLSLRAAHHLII